MNTRAVRFSGLVAIAIVALATVWLWSRKPSRPTQPNLGRPATQADDARGPVDPRSGRTDRSVSLALPRNGDPATLQRWIQDHQDRLAALPREETSAQLVELLRSGRDAPTGLGFELGTGGLLQEAPTLRVWLLDQLAQLDPGAAAREARDILSRMESADEWAVALRICATADDTSDGLAFVREKARQMIRYVPWLETPSTGFLEAFDLFVYTRDLEIVPELAALLRRRENRAVAHAAYLTLDRLILTAPQPMLDLLVGDPGLLEGREATRGNYLARADVSDPAQRRLVEDYLLDPARSWSELEAFAGTFPNANFMVSNNLLTPSPTLPGTELRRRDVAAAQVVNQWTADPRFERLRPLLEPMKRRLDEFVRQHEAGP